MKLDISDVELLRHGLHKAAQAVENSPLLTRKGKDEELHRINKLDQKLVQELNELNAAHMADLGLL